MAGEKKNSGIFYHNWLGEIEDLTDEEAGRLFRVLLTYSATGKELAMDRVVRAHFLHMKTRMDADREEYERVVRVRAAAGARGGRPKKRAEDGEKPTEAKKAKGFRAKQTNPDPGTVSDPGTGFPEEEGDLHKVGGAQQDEAFRDKANRMFLEGYCERGGAFDSVLWEEYHEAAGGYGGKVLYAALSRMRQRRRIAEPVKYLVSVCESILREPGPKGGGRE